MSDLESYIETSLPNCGYLPHKQSRAEEIYKMIEHIVRSGLPIGMAVFEIDGIGVDLVIHVKKEKK